MFRNWLNGVKKQTKVQIHIGVCALVWALWNCRNDMVFNMISDMGIPYRVLSVVVSGTN
jgi:hypothetical protein